MTNTTKYVTIIFPQQGGLAMTQRNTDFFYEGKNVPKTLKNSIYKMEDITGIVGEKSVFENIMTSLLEEFMHKKNINLSKVERYVNEKAKNIKLYVMYFQNENGDEFKCAYLGEKGSLKNGTTHILASSIIFTFAKYGCKHCNFKETDCEFCERKKIDKIFPPEMELTIKHNMDNFIKVFGKDSVKSIKDFCEGYYAYMRQNSSKESHDSLEEQRQEESVPPVVKEFLQIDPGVIEYVIKMTTAILGEYANDNKDIRNIMSEYTNVEKSFLSVIHHLQKYHAFVKMIKENPNDLPEELIENMEEINQDDINSFDEEEDDDGESWKNGSTDEDE